MSFLTFTYLVTGRNQLILIEKLQKAGVNLKKIENIDAKRLKITIDSKDRLKFFAICKNSWYNRLVKVGGFFAPAYKLAKNFYLFIGILLFFAISIYANTLYFQTQFEGDALLFSKQIESTFQQVGIRKFHPFTQAQLDSVKLILERDEKLSFISVTKKGNSAVVYLKQSLTEPTTLPTLNSDFLAPEDMTVLKITVYSGRAIAQPNTFVKKGEIVAKASYLIKDSEVACKLAFTMLSECTFVYEYESAYKIDDSVKNNALTLAKVVLGDYTVRSYNFEIVGIKRVKVILKYEKTFFGG